jgi:hypothetical protein
MKPVEGNRLEIEGTPIFLDLGAIFADLDEDAGEAKA